MAFFGSARIIITGEQENIHGALALLRSFPRLQLCDVNTQTKNSNPYTPVKAEAALLAQNVGALDKKAKRAKSDPNVVEAGAERAEAYCRWLEITKSEHKGLLSEKAKLEGEIAECVSAQKILSRFEGKKIDFGRYKDADNFALRIGRMPKKAYKRLLKICRDGGEIFLPFASVKKKIAYVMYLCPIGVAESKSAFLAELGFEFLAPSYIKRTPDESLEEINRSISENNVALQDLQERIKEFCSENREVIFQILEHLELSEKHFDDREKADIKDGVFTAEVILKGVSRRKIAKKLAAIGCRAMPKNDQRR